MKDKDGLVVLLGNTRGTLQRNIIEPLQQMWGTNLVGDVNSQNKCYMFGEWVHCLGSDKVNQVNRLRGSSIKLCFGDEVVTWHREVFEMLKSRLDKPYSQFFGTANPEAPNHWLKKDFIDTAKEKDIDLFYQHYEIFDNPYCEIVEELCKEYQGTIYYDKYILGLWKRAEGICFPQFSNDPTPWLISSKDLFDKEGKVKRFEWIEAGYDAGGAGSAFSFTVTGKDWNDNYYVLYSKKTQATDIDMSEATKIATNGNTHIKNIYKQDVEYISVDDNYKIIINELKNLGLSAGYCYKPPLEDRPFAISRLLANKKIVFVKEHTADLIDELQNLVFDDKKERAIVLDDGTMQVDSWDSFIYSISHSWSRLSE